MQITISRERAAIARAFLEQSMSRESTSLMAFAQEVSARCAARRERARRHMQSQPTIPVLGDAPERP